MTNHRSYMECISVYWNRLVKARYIAASLTKLFRSHRPVMSECESDIGKIKARIISGLIYRRLEACRRELSAEPLRDGMVIPMPGIENHNTHPDYERTKQSNHPGARTAAGFQSET
jgi:hypothetical protein